MTHGRPNQFTDSELTMIWIRYHLWSQNRPNLIAADYGVSPAYISAIGKRTTPCQPRPRLNQSKRSRSTSAREISTSLSNGSGMDGRQRLEK